MILVYVYVNRLLSIMHNIENSTLKKSGEFLSDSDAKLFLVNVYTNV